MQQVAIAGVAKVIWQKTNCPARGKTCKKFEFIVHFASMVGKSGYNGSDGNADDSSHRAS